jgi:hypothetical protein
LKLRVGGASRSDADVPPLVRLYLDRVLSSNGSVPRVVRLAQAGELRQKPDGPWLRFTAVQEFAVEEPAFSWRARVRMMPLVSIRVVDRYSGDEGTGEVRLVGLLPIARDSGQHVSEGSALRYLAELPWNPHAMYANRQLEWSELDAQRVEVAMRVGPKRVALRLEFDEAGNIIRVWTDARPRKEAGKFVSSPWGGVYSNLEVVGGIGIPTRAEVSWELPDGPFTWFRATITTLELDPPA